MKAVGKYILIEPAKEKEVSTKGGLLLAESHREDIRYREAKVKTIGTLVQGIEDGDTIYYDRHAGHKIELDRETYHVIKAQDVVFVL